MFLQRIDFIDKDYFDHILISQYGSFKEAATNLNISVQSIYYIRRHERMSLDFFTYLIDEIPEIQAKKLMPKLAAYFK